MYEDDMAELDEYLFELWEQDRDQDNAELGDNFDFDELCFEYFE